MSNHKNHITMTYNSTYSKQLMFSTAVFSVLFISIIAILAYRLPEMRQASYAFYTSMFAILVLCFVLLHGFCFQIRNVEYNDKKLTVKRLIGEVNIPLDDIQSIGRKKSLFRDMRIFGIGGLFGYIGYFRGGDCGNYTAYANNGDNAFYIKTKSGKCYVASCDDVDSLIQKLSK